MSVVRRGSPGPRPGTVRRPPRVDGEHFAALTAALWSEREALETVLYRLVLQRLVLTTPGRRWLARSADDLRDALEQLDAATGDREHAASGCGPHATLAELAARAPEPWPTVLHDHRLAVRVLLRDTRAEVAVVAELLSTSSRDVAESLAEFTEVLADFRTAERALLVSAADATHAAAHETLARVERPDLALFVA